MAKNLLEGAADGDEMTMTGISSDSPGWKRGRGGAREERVATAFVDVVVSSTHGDARIVKPWRGESNQSARQSWCGGGGGGYRDEIHRKGHRRTLCLLALGPRH